MKNKWRILKILSTLIIFGFLLSFSLKRFNNASMEKVSVNMAYPHNDEKVYFIDEKDVKDFIKKSNPSKRIGDIDIPMLEKEVNNFPSVDSANVYLNLNGNLNVDIVQKVPAFRLNKNGQDFYVDKKGNEFPISKNYSHPSMLVTGDVKRGEYLKLAELVEKINKDDFSRKYFIGIKKEKNSYYLLTSEGNFRVEIGDLDHIEFKVKGFKAFVEKFLVYQDPQKYSKVSVRYDNQIVTTLNPNYKENDSIISARKKEFDKAPEIVRKKALAQATQNNSVKPVEKKPEAAKTAEKKVEKKTETKPREKPKVTEKKEEPKKKTQIKELKKIKST
ncbi:cell division protein FtsQ [Chryseobacterium taklimakanense]|uniref:Cell division protein FtsQ n=1 Tax=Chryseobacterium taklimakanense TaxID=536441 RepID=A0A3G8WLE1_9FLAO|nr:cell division protein FtsQ [Chryseobacterium taklimakanense]AZI21303.1 cell division protein FtsQ [Chryseobacterium taklimakanense]